MYREFFAISKGAILYLMPSTEEIPEMGMIKALNLFSGLTDAQRCPVKRTYFNPTGAIASDTATSFAPGFPETAFA